MTDAGNIADVCAALSDIGRLRILHSLDGAQLCVCQIEALLGLASSTVSRHVDVLRRAGLIESRREGRWIHIRRVRQPVADAALRAFARTAQAASDGKAMAAIRRQSREALCSQLRRS